MSDFDELRNGGSPAVPGTPPPPIPEGSPEPERAADPAVPSAAPLNPVGYTILVEAAKIEFPKYGHTTFQTLDPAKRYLTLTATQRYCGSTGLVESGPLGISGTRTSSIDPVTGEETAEGPGYVGSFGEAISPICRSGTGQQSSYDDPPNQLADGIASFSGVSVLSDENTTAMMLANGKEQLPDFAGALTIGTPEAYRNVHQNELQFDYQRVQFKFDWDDGSSVTQHHPIQYWVVFRPEDDPETPEDESLAGATICDEIGWDGVADQSPVFTIDPDLLQPDTDGTYSLATGCLAVDANRDGTIKLASEDDSDATTSAKPFRFWLNDDDDWADLGSNSGLTGQGPTDVPGQGQAWSNPNTNNNGADYSTDIAGKGIVDGAADFVDFFPVFLDIKQLVGVLPPSTSIRYKLKHSGGALNFVYTKLTRANACTYQSESTGTIFGDILDRSLKTAQTHQITSAGTDLAEYGDTFLNGVKNNDWGVILVEGRSATTEPLRLVVEKDGVEIAEVKLEISISSVEDMYRSINLRDGADAPAGLAGDLSVRDSDLGRPTSLTEPTNSPDNLTNGKWFVFVVGSNVGGQKMRGWQSEVFKRMFWSQSKARFVGVSWYGDPYSDGDDLVYDYHSAARNAFTTASALTAKINGLSGGKTIAGHSAACLIISSAIADYGLNVSNACLIDAAMARESFDGSSADDLTGMVPAAWRNYPPALWAAHWHEAFGAVDARSRLTWRNRFSAAAGAIHNFYSSTEDVLARYDGTVEHSIIENLRAPGSFAWVVQEKAKGDKLRIGWFIHAGSDYGGWGANIHDPITSNLPKWYLTNNNAQRVPLTPAQIGTVTSQMLADIKVQPFFRTGWGRYYNGNPAQELVDTSPDYYTGPSWILDLYGVTTGNAIATDPANRSQLLNEAIPALSLAVGSNHTDRFGDTRNYDLASRYADFALWPSGRGATVGGVPNWHHSDMREVAYLYLARFYDKLSSLSNQ